MTEHNPSRAVLPAGPWTAKRAVIGIVSLVVATGIMLGILQWLGIIAESLGTAIIMFVLAGIGVCAGTVAARQRKQGNWQSALTAYRIAFWCLLLAFWQAATAYPAAKNREAFMKEYQEREKLLEPRQRSPQ